MKKETAVSKFISKWKRQNKLLRIFFLIVTIIYLISVIIFTRELLTLVGIETGIRVLILLIFYLHFFVLSLGGIIFLYTKKKIRLIIVLVLSCVYIPVLGVASYYIDKTYNIIDNVQKKYVEYTSVMISLKDTNEYNKIGIINSENDPTGYTIPKKMIKENKIDGELVTYDDYISMMSDLYDGKIDALFVTNGYITMFNSYDKFQNVEEETKIVYSKTEELENIDNVSYSTKKLTEPFTMLLMGVDSTGNGISKGSSFNGDTLMLITFNPKTLNATIFSIPRDTYVPIACSQNRENKINSSAYGGTSCVVNTIENLTGIKIDYYMKINFTGVVKLVDDLGGINLDVPIKFCEQDSQRRFGEYLICLDPGYQKLNGEQALALARHRHSLPLGDFQRVQHQQLVVEAMIREFKNINKVDDFYKILDDVANNIDTNMTTAQILSLYSVGKNILTNMLQGNDSLSIEKTYLTGYDLTMYMDNYRSFIYTFQYYKSSLEEIVNLMKVNLELEKPTLIKTFEFDASIEYEIPVAGKKHDKEPRRELLPNFVGQKQEDVINWAKDRDIEVLFKTEDSDYPNGQVIGQSEHNGKLVSKITSITIVISRNNSNNQNTPKPDDNDDEAIPNFIGMTIQEFNKWKNGLKNQNIVFNTKELTANDLLELDETDLKNDVIYKQSHPKGTKLEDISTLTVYYYKNQE